MTVRDAQRNARDTEILITLVSSAAEMRTSFENMKRFIAEQDSMLVDVGNKQHEKSQRVMLGGPRPPPAARTPRRAASAEDGEEMGVKRRNVFRRALKGLSGKNSGELANIELMLNRLLDEVADLKAGQDERPISSQTPLRRGYSHDQLHDDGPPQDGYEPEGQAGTTSSSTGNQSGYFSNPPSRQGSRPSGYERRRASENRVSTVMEEGEELEPQPAHDLGYDDDDHDDGQLTPTRDRMPRGGSVPLDTPPTAHFAHSNAVHSAENTPRTDKSRKHKSSSSSFFPKITSRWSKTTASSVVDNLRGSGKKDRPISGVSQSGSEGAAYDSGAHYDPHGDDRIRSEASLARGQHDLTPTRERPGRRPSSPLVPSALSSHASDQPQYSAHRDSANLQHPQPRPGPTARYQRALESQAHDIGGPAAKSSSPMSPSSDHFGSNPVLARYSGGGGATVGHYTAGNGSGHLSPIEDRSSYDGGSRAASASRDGPPRPPKVRDDGPLVPPKEPLEASTGNTGRNFAGRAGAAEYTTVCTSL